jgi:predicted ATPase
MKILSVKLGNATDIGFQFPEIRLKKLNLFVGESASGKSTFLNLFFNSALKAAQDAGGIVGFIRIEFEESATRYVWECVSKKGDNQKLEIKSELLLKYLEDGSSVNLLDRHDGSVTVNGVQAPRIANQSMSIYLFREDESIKQAHKAFTKLLRRDFAANELNNAFALQALRKGALDVFEKNKSLERMMEFSSVNPRLFILSKYFPDKYEAICTAFKSIFPFVEKLEFKDMSDVDEGIGYSGRMPLLHIKDKNVDELIAIPDISSGMKKALLIISDVIASPDGTVYLIDEYENSLGINAINFLPNFIAEYGGGKQFIITSHHPYLINAIPVDNWIVFHRDGLNIAVKQGEDLVESYGRSKQQAFIKLINDPFFTDGQ